MTTKKMTQASKTKAQASNAKNNEHKDTLLESLVFLTAHHGRAKSAEAIRAGLPYDESGMGPQLFAEAADRLGLKTKFIEQKDVTAISDDVLPAILILQEDQACILLERTDGKCKIFVSSTGQKRTLSEDDLQTVYTGNAIYVYPRAEFKDPNAPQKKESSRHWFWGLVHENRSIYGQVIVAAILINLFGLAGPLFIMNVYDRVIPNNAIETGWVLGVGALTIYVFDFIIRTLRGYFVDLAGRRIDVMASRRIYDQLLNIKLAGRPGSSGAFANMLREFESVRDFMTSATITAVVDLPFTLFFLFVIFMLGGPIAFVLALLVIIVIGAGLFIQVPLKNLVARSLHAGEAKHGLLVETINALETIKSISADGRMRSRYSAHVGESAAHAQKSRFISAIGINFSTMVQQSATIVIVLLGMYLVRDSVLTMGALIACVILAGRAMAPIGQVANLLARFHQARGSLHTLNDIMALPVERPLEKQFLHRPSLKGDIKMEKVGFSYPGTERKVIDGVSFKIKAGEKVGIIGRIGSGKSTLVRMILGLYDADEGAVYADDTDYRQIDPADLRRNIAYIAQDVVLFRGTVRENIAISRPEATEEEILEASKMAGVHDFISRHPMGYDAPVGERGEGLSGGQRQAIAMARAMLLQPNIFVCDEPTNAMDIQAEEAFTKHIAKQVKDKTFILITHRQYLLNIVDRLILMDQGRVLIDGPRDKVLEALASGIKAPQDPQSNKGES